MNIPRSLAVLVFCSVALVACSSSDVPSGPAGAAGPAGPAAPGLKIRPPDATGTVASETAVSGSLKFTLALDPGSTYTDATTFDIAATAGSTGQDGVVFDAMAITMGERISVWVASCDDAKMACGVDHVQNGG